MNTKRSTSYLTLFNRDLNTKHSALAKSLSAPSSLLRESAIDVNIGGWDYLDVRSWALELRGRE